MNDPPRTRCSASQSRKEFAAQNFHNESVILRLLPVLSKPQPMSKLFHIQCSHSNEIASLSIYLNIVCKSNLIVQWILMLQRQLHTCIPIPSYRGMLRQLASMPFSRISPRVRNRGQLRVLSMLHKRGEGGADRRKVQRGYPDKALLQQDELLFGGACSSRSHLLCSRNYCNDDIVLASTENLRQ